MPLSATVTGTITMADLAQMAFRRDGEGGLLGSVTVPIDIEGIIQQRTYEWTLTAGQVATLVADYVPSALQAARDGAGV